MATADSPHRLGVISATAYLIGDIIGSGIFIAPQGILHNTGSIALSLAVWAACGLLSLVGALCYVELGTSIPLSGGDFAYLCYYKWYPVAFAFLWTTFIIYKPCSIAILVKTFGAYVLQALSPVFCFQPHITDAAGKLIGFLLLLLLTWINFYHLAKYAAKIQIVVTLCKVGSLLLLIGTGIYAVTTDGISNLANPMDGTQWGTNIVIAFYGGLWAYDGWDTLNFGVEELHNPKRTLVLAVFGGTTVVMLIYLMVNVAYFAVLGKEGVMQSEAVAQTFSQAMLGNFSYAIPAIVGVVILGTVNASLFTSSRYFFAAAREGHLPSFMKLLSVKHATPQPALCLYAVMAIIMANVAGVDDLINYVVFVLWLQRLFVISGLIWIRLKKTPVDKSAVKVPLILHVFFLIMNAFVVGVATYQAPSVSAVGFGVALSGLLVYFLLVHPKTLPSVLVTFDRSILKLCQIIFVAMPDESGQSKLTQSAPTQVAPQEGECSTVTERF